MSVECLELGIRIENLERSVFLIASYKLFGIQINKRAAGVSREKDSLVLPLSSISTFFVKQGLDSMK